MSDKENKPSDSEESNKSTVDMVCDDFRLMEKGFAKAGKRMFEGAAAGMQAYMDSVDKAEDKCHLNMPTAIAKGMAKAMAETAKVASGAPADIADAMSKCESVKRVLD